MIFAEEKKWRERGKKMRVSTAAVGSYGSRAAISTLKTCKEINSHHIKKCSAQLCYSIDMKVTIKQEYCLKTVDSSLLRSQKDRERMKSNKK